MSEVSREVESWEDERVSIAMKEIFIAAKNYQLSEDARILILAIEEELFASEVQIEA